ncbi:MAG: amphi-Trp domain-containing protein [Planctomycetota bacterium]
MLRALVLTPTSKKNLRSKDRDVEKEYPLPQFIAKLRRLADDLEAREQFEIQNAGERLYVPVRAKYSVEHECEDGNHEVEFQVSWDEE